MGLETMREITNLVADYLLLTAVPAMFLFVWYYARAGMWKKNFVGRTMMYLAISLGILLLVNTASIWVGPDYWGRPLVRVLSYAGLSFTAWRLWLTLRHVQRAEHHNPDFKVEDLDRTWPKHKLPKK